MTAIKNPDAGRRSIASAGPDRTTPPWHGLSPEESAKRCETSLAQGLAPSESIFAHGMRQHIIWVGLLIAGRCFAEQ